MSAPVAWNVCLDALLGEMTLGVLLHDLRGGLSVVQGWVEVAALDGQLSSSQLDRSLVALSETLSAAGQNLAPQSQLPSVSVEALLEDLPGARRPIVDIRACVCVERFRSAMALAVPASIALMAPAAAGRVVLEVSGLTEEGVSQACRPSLTRLGELRRERSDDRTLGASLLRVVAQSAGGHLRAVGPDKIELHFNGEESN